jgi:putative MATE family efflux protein
MAAATSQDLLTGSVPKQLIKFSMPFLAANVLQSVYAVVDMIIVGQFVGAAGLSGVSVGSQIAALFTSTGTGLAMGGQMMLAQYKGAGDEKAQKESIGTMLTFMLVLGLVLSIPCIALARPLLSVLNTPAESYQDAYWYFIISALGIVFIFGYNSVCAVLRGLGDSKRPMYFVGVSTVSNIILDLLFVGAMDKGAGGAAAATIIAQGISFVTALVYLYRHRESFVFDFHRNSFKIIGARLKTMLKVGIPFALQFSMLMISMLFVVALVNGYGVSASAGYGVGGKVDNFATLPVYAITAAASTMVGQNIGAKQLDRARSVVHWCVVMTLACELVIFALVQGFAAQIIRIFNSDPEVVAVGVQYLRLMTFAYLAHCFLDGYQAMANGVGFSMLSFICCTVDGLIVRIPLAWLFGSILGLGLQGVFLGCMLAPFSAALISCIYFYSGAWKKHSLVAKE